MEQVELPIDVETGPDEPINVEIEPDEISEVENLNETTDTIPYNEVEAAEPPEIEDPNESIETLPYNDIEALESRSVLMGTEDHKSMESLHKEGSLNSDSNGLVPEMEETSEELGGRGMSTKVPRSITTYSELGVPKRTGSSSLSVRI